MSSQRAGPETPSSNECSSFQPGAFRGGLWFERHDSNGKRFRFDTVNQCLWKQVPSAPDQRLLLAPKALAVLKHLIDCAGRLVTHEEFLEVVWPGVYVQPEVLKSQILLLRSVLEDDARHPGFIETLARRGYRFMARVCVDEVTIPGAATQPCVLPALVGRDGPLSDLKALLQRTVRQQRREVVFVTGETGIGKTSLVDAFLCQVRREMPHARLARGQCVEGYGGKEAYYPMLEALRDLCTGQGGAQLLREIASCAPGWLAQIPALQPAQKPPLQRELLDGIRERMPRELVNLFQRVTNESPTVLVFEDLQWSDPATVSLLEILARTRTPMQLMLIGTYRTADQMSGGDHVCRALRQELQLHGLCGELPLEPLSEDQIAAYLTGQVSGEASPPDGLAELIYRQTEGNPLFMVTLLEHLCRRGLLSNLGAAWQLEVPLHTIEFEVPETLREMIDAQVAQLSTEEKRVLEVAGIMGVEFCPQWCADAAGLDPERAEELCQALAERHCILRQSHSTSPRSPGSTATRYEFAHAMYREVLYRYATPTRRARLYLKVARWLQSASPAVQPQPAPVLTCQAERGCGGRVDTATYLPRTSLMCSA